MSAFVDMLNTSYPQPSPSPGESKNDYLRMFVGNNASLLSHKQTFEMYLANVKKTNDPAVQYEFAVFMVNAIQEMDGTMNDSSASLDKEKDKEPGITRSRLLSEAKAILQRLADKSYPYAQYYLADGYSSGLFNKGKVDYDRALPLFVAASKHGHAEASYRAGLCNEFGWGCRVDGGKAAQFYRQAAAKNHPGACLRLGKACLAGEMGLGKRYREGIKWLKRAAESADEQYNAGPYELGLLHETGYGDDVFKDESYAAQLFTKSADLGHVEACFRMGEAYEYGKLNCPRDPALSIHFYTLAAQRGHPKAQMALCAWYMLGAEPVLEKDEMEAYEWARKAAEQGALYHLDISWTVSSLGVIIQVTQKHSTRLAVLRKWALAATVIPSRPTCGTSAPRTRVTSGPGTASLSSKRHLKERIQREEANVEKASVPRRPKVGRPRIKPGTTG